MKGQHRGAAQNHRFAPSGSGCGMPGSPKGWWLHLRPCPGDAIDAFAGGPISQFGPFAADFDGDINVNGGVFNNAASMIIDHPLDPANEYLSHSSVESPDTMNIYNSNVVTDANGDAVVPLPEWFETLNGDFRYQLTTIGQPAQAWIAPKIANHSFTIKTDKPNVEISWQVTGVRQDAWANAHRIPIEAPKLGHEVGHYLHPELYGAPEEASIAWARHPETMRRIKEMREKSSHLPQASGIADPAAAAKR
jgi:trimeric autotransporter adhesin